MAQKVEYIVEVSRTGNGATEAAAQLAQLNTGFVAMEKGTKSATAGLRALSNVAVLAGGSAFPQATLAAMTLKQSFDAIKLASAAAGTSIGAIAGPLTVIVAGIVAAGKAVKDYLSMMDAMKAEHQSQVDLSASAANQGKRINDALIAAMQDGRVKISAERAATWDAILAKPSPEALAKLRQTISQEMPNLFLTEGQRSQIASQAISDSERQIQLAITTAQAAGNNRVAQEELNGAYSKRLTLLNELQAKGIIGNKELADAANDAAIAENQRLIQRKGHLTDIQQLERSILETSAASLASMAVNFKNAQNAALELSKAIAQMIIQMLIMRAIRASFPGLFPLAGGGQVASAAAFGGQFPIMAANGVNGVREVSTPTYFPKFNVLAGEAGREVMTVMARPRLMNVGGIAAQIGDVGPNRLAITSAGDLQRLGKGGGIPQIHVHLYESATARADIIGEASEVSVHKVTQKMKQRGPLSESVKRLSNQ